MRFRRPSVLVAQYLVKIFFHGVRGPLVNAETLDFVVVLVVQN